MNLMVAALGNVLYDREQKALTGRDERGLLRVITKAGMTAVDAGANVFVFTASPRSDPSSRI